MICKNCNSVVDEGSVFCGVCGTRLDENTKQQPAPIPAEEQEKAAEAPVAEVTVAETPVANVPVSETSLAEDLAIEAPAPKKKFPKKLAVIAAVLVLFVGAFAAFASFSGIFKSDAEAYCELEIASINDGLSAFADAWEDAFDFDGGSADIKLTVSDEVVAMLGENAALLGDVRSLGLNGDFALKDKLAGALMNLSVGDAELFGFEVIYDVDTGSLYMSFPGLNEKAIELDLSELMEEGGYSLSEFSEALETITEFLNEAEVQPVVLDVVSAAIGEIKDVEKSKGTAIVGDVKQKCTVYTINVDEVLLENMAKAVLKEVKENKKLKELVYDAADMLTTVNGGASMYNKSQLSTMIDQAIDSAIENIDLRGTDIGFTYRLYADGGDVLGREITAEGQTLKYIGAKSGSDYAFELSFGDGEYKEFSISIDGTLKSDKFTGDMNFEISGEEVIAVDFNDFEFDLDKQIAKGEMTVGFGNGIESFMNVYGDSSVSLKSLKLVYTYNNTEKSVDTKVDVNAGGINLLEIAVKGDNKTKYSPKIPLDIYAGDIDDYMNDVDPYALIEKLKGAGFAPEIFAGLEPAEEEVDESFSEDLEMEAFSADGL